MRFIDLIQIAGIVIIFGAPIIWILSRVQMKAWIHTIDKHLNKSKNYGKEEE